VIQSFNRLFQARSSFEGAAEPDNWGDRVSLLSWTERLARPEGFEHTPPTIVIEGAEELVAVLRAA